jgi:SAM-dependent methyltransferase
MPTNLQVSAEYTVKDQERMGRAQRYFHWQFRLAEAHLGRRVLEVGCGIGNFTRLLLDRDLVVGIDIEPGCVAKLRQSLGGHANLITFHMDVMDPAFLALSAYDLDSVVCLNVLEHLPDDRRALCHIHAVLRPGGKVVLVVPAFECLYGPIDAHLGHYRRYSKQSLAALARSVGFQLVTLRYLNALGFLGWWWNARILKKTRQSELQIAIFDALFVPLLSRIEKWVEPPFGQSIFAVFVK